MSLDASELEGLSEAELRRRYDAQSRGNASVLGAANREDFSDVFAQEMAKKRREMERDTAWLSVPCTQRPLVATE